MARKFLTPIDMSNLELLNARAQNVASLPTGLGPGDAGRIVYLTTNSRFYQWGGSSWGATSDSADQLGGALDSAVHPGSWYQSRANHAGTQTSSTISDFQATVFGYRWTSLTAPNAAVNVNSQKLTAVADPTVSTDAATKNYVDTQVGSLTSGMVMKGSVRVASSTNIASPTTAPGSTIDGVTMSAGDVFLLTGQTTAAQNGPWVWASATSAARPTNYASGATATPGSFWDVREGTNADLFALLTTDVAITVDTTPTAFVIRGNAGATYTATYPITLSGAAFGLNYTTGFAGGLSLASNSLQVDSAVVARKVTGTVPASTSGIFSVSGATVTVNHALNNWAVSVTIRAGSVPPSGTVTGQLVEVDDTASDANNVVLAFPAAPAANNYLISIVG
jgi:hypothetical protein